MLCRELCVALLSPFVCLSTTNIIITKKTKGRPTYLVDYAVYRPPDSWKWSRDYALHMAKSLEFEKGRPIFDDSTIDFQNKVLARSGLGNDTYLPPCMADLANPVPTMANARWEFEQVCFTAVRDVLDKTGVQPRQVGVLIVNCSLFNPTPSLSATLMNHFRMSSKTINYNLSGMGCSGEEWCCVVCLFVCLHMCRVL